MSKKHKGVPMVAVRTKDPYHADVTITKYEPAKQGKPKYPVATCVKCNKPVSIRGEMPEEVWCSECLNKADKDAARKRRVEEAARVYRKCVSCGKSFYIKEAKAKELQDAGLKLFTHCYDCQHASKKVQNESHS